MRFLLDTTIVSAPVARRPDPRIVKQLERHGPQCALPAPVWHELVHGCERLPAGRRRNALQEYLADVVRSSFPVLPYDEAAAAWHGRERARLENIGEAPPFVDGQIAAIAATTDLALVTINTRHFRAFRDLEVINWAR
jgi:tRNA(fMet)-specific endonuclease VapC